MPRLLPLLCLLACLLVPAVSAWAEEVFILDNGNVVRGRVVREDGEKIVVRLSGFVRENRITLQPDEIVRRFVSVDPRRRAHPPVAKEELTLAYQSESVRDGVPRTVLLAPPSAVTRNRTRAGGASSLPRREAALASENFFSRLRQVSIVAAPGTVEGRVLLGLLLFVLLTVLVAGGSRLLGMRAVSLHASSSLGLLLGIFLVGDLVWSEALLRADRALWLVPLQAAIWLGIARSTLDAPLSRTIPLFAIVLFASTCFVFATGSVLISI